MSDTIAAALSPAEWENFDCPQGIVEFRETIRRATRTEVDDALLHAVGAKALHRHPLGFTVFDVVNLRELAGILRGEIPERRIHGSAGLCEHLAARIEALLPPEGA